MRYLTTVRLLVGLYDGWHEGTEQAERVLSAYLLDDETKIWIITEWDRSATTILLPEEY